MAPEQGDLALLDTPLARELLQPRIPARLAYAWPDGTPRVVPIWFHWDGERVVMVGPADAPKVRALRARPAVAITIDDAGGWPYSVLLLRGTAQIDVVEGIAPEYAAAAERYFGPERGRAWVQNVGPLMPRTARIAVRPAWVGLLDFQGRFPEAFARRKG
jgi:PPOX class probable F420-dependent enzyme